MEQLKCRYDRYLTEARQARQEAGLCDGLFGMGNDPRRHSCHRAFYEDTGRWVTEFLAGEPDAEACAAAAVWILEAADRNREERDAYGYLYAAQVHALALIPKLERQAARELLDWYARAYPPKERMPVQDQVYGALKKAARGRLW